GAGGGRAPVGGGPCRRGGPARAARRAPPGRPQRGPASNGGAARYVLPVSLGTGMLLFAGALLLRSSAPTTAEGKERGQVASARETRPEPPLSVPAPPPRRPRTEPTKEASRQPAPEPPKPRQTETPPEPEKQPEPAPPPPP